MNLGENKGEMKVWLYSGETTLRILQEVLIGVVFIIKQGEGRRMEVEGESLISVNIESKVLALRPGSGSHLAPNNMIFP